MDESIYYDNYMDDNDSGNYDPFEEDPRYRRYYKIKKIVKIAFKSLVALTIFAVIATLLFRIYTIQEPDMASEFLWNQKGIDAYHANTDFKVYGQKMSSYMWKDPETGANKNIERDSFNEAETMRVTNIYYSPDAGQLQVTLRWNQNAQKDVLQYYREEALPQGETFYFFLTDDKGNTYGEASYIKGSRYVYTFRRLLFDGIKFSDPNDPNDLSGVNELYLNIYYTGKPSTQPFEQMIVYDNNIESFEVNAPKPSSVTKSLTVQPGKKG